jgi:hypothetical protein
MKEKFRDYDWHLTRQTRVFSYKGFFDLKKKSKVRNYKPIKPYKPITPQSLKPVQNPNNQFYHFRITSPSS